MWFHNLNGWVIVVHSMLIYRVFFIMRWTWVCEWLSQWTFNENKNITYCYFEFKTSALNNRYWYVLIYFLSPDCDQRTIFFFSISDNAAYVFPFLSKILRDKTNDYAYVPHKLFKTLNGWQYCTEIKSRFIFLSKTTWEIISLQYCKSFDTDSQSLLC